MFASGALDEAHLQYGIESAPIRRKWMYWNLVQTIISKAAGGLVSANSISLQNRRSVQKSFSHFFLPSTNNFKSGLSSVSLDLYTTFHFHIFLEKNPTTKCGDDCFIFSTCHSQRLICLFKVQSVAVSMFPLQTQEHPPQTI